MLAVSDTGSGMPPEVIDKVFEPFFSTKSEGKGSGLGLSMVYGFVKQSGGHVKIYSEVGEGTTIKLYLPRAMQSEDVEVATVIGPIVGGSETVLVVEDDAEVRDTVVEMLSDLGYRVLKAVDAASGLSVIDSGILIDVLFTDVVMPGTLKSPELARKARERLPDIAVLFTSGYTENSIVHGGKLDSGVELLSKPYSCEALARKFNHVLANQRQRKENRAALRGDDSSLAAIAGRITRRTILLVEDDDLIRMSSAEMLEASGFAVIDAASAEEAISAISTLPIDVLITDVNLPGMSGPELARTARAQRPQLGIVFASGDLTAIATDVPAVQLPKPYRPTHLIASVERALAIAGTTTTSD
jgi:CheY-like chemotaxis protein